MFAGANFCRPTACYYRREPVMFRQNPFVHESAVRQSS